MKSGTAFILGGLLQGAGKGITNLHEERRQNALLKLKRDQELENRSLDAAEVEAKRVADLAAKKELLREASEQDIEKAKITSNLKRAEREVDYTYDVKLENVRSGLKVKEDAASKRLAAEIDKGQVKSIEAADDGTMLVAYNDGTVVKKNIKLRETRASGGEDDIPTISAARGERGSTPVAKPAAPASTDIPGEKGAALARLGQVYANATPDRYPGLFRNGKKIPIEEAKQLIYQRYGG